SLDMRPTTRSIYGFESPVSAPTTPVVESEPFSQLPHQQQPVQNSQHHQHQQLLQQQQQHLEELSQQNLDLLASNQLQAHIPVLERAHDQAMEELDHVRGKDLLLSSQVYQNGRTGDMEHEATALLTSVDAQNGSVLTGEQENASQQGVPSVRQYSFVMGFRANCEKCQRREKGHIAHLVERVVPVKP
ncbi:hypothetical protein BGZ94_005992, partial [Podila epigama]